MGTNYYINIDPCEKCGRSDTEYHIGKSSAGWCFSLHVEPDENIHRLGDVTGMWKDNIIKNEYGEIIPPEEMLSIITQRSKTNNDFHEQPIRYSSWKEFHKLNHSEFGPNGLLRHQIDGSHCIGHGEGTYDYITGEFS